jgi:hypothetical protein
MKLLTFLFAGALLAQDTISVQGPITAHPPLSLDSAGNLNCAGCTGGGSGGTGSGLMPWNPAPAAPPTLPNWTPINGGSNGQFADVTNGVLINAPSGNNIKGLWLTPPSGAWTLTAHQNAICTSPAGQAPEYGVLVGDTGSKIVTFGFRGAGGPDVNYWNDPTTASGFGSQPFSGSALVQTPDIWFRIKYDQTNFYFQFSGTGADSASWVTMFQAAANTFLASNPAKIGFYTYSQVTNQPCVSTLNFWNVSPL